MAVFAEPFPDKADQHAHDDRRRRSPGTAAVPSAQVRPSQRRQIVGQQPHRAPARGWPAQPSAAQGRQGARNSKRRYRIIRSRPRWVRPKYRRRPARSASARRQVTCRSAGRADSLPVLKNGTFLSSTFTASPVRGLRPTRASRALTENAPKPRSSTRSPLASASMISSKTVFTIRSTWRCVRCGFSSAIFWISSERIIRVPPVVRSPCMGSDRHDVVLARL